jgi:hypothetical protein
MNRIALFLCTLVAPAAVFQPAFAQTAFDRQMAQFLGASGPPTELGWSVSDDSNTPGKNCILTHNWSGSMVRYLGPTPNWNKAFIVFMGPTTPQPRQAKAARITLSSRGDPDQTVRATLFPLETRRTGAVVFEMSSIEAAMAAMDDEKNVTLSLRGFPIFQSQWVGGHAARDLMNACLRK